MKSAGDCKLLQSYMNSVQKWCTENCMKINAYKTNIIYFARITDSIDFNYFLGDLVIVRTDCVKYIVLCYITNCIFVVMLTACILRH
jgi:hypothetical protein